MTTLATLVHPPVTLRWLMQADLPQVLRIEKSVPGCRWTELDFLTALRSIETIGQVAELDDRVVGYVIYKSTRPAEPSVRLPELTSRFAAWWPPTEEPRRPVHVTLLNIAVAAAWQRRGVGRDMLAKLEQKLEPGGGHIRAMVPETNLAIQLFLRRAGYRALQVFRAYYGSEDAYLMERTARRPSPPTPLPRGARGEIHFPSPLGGEG
jgi:ribosomal protein S18 acetylase RimI-like enzyme